jgi:hypothetical protein
MRNKVVPGLRNVSSSPLPGSKLALYNRNDLRIVWSRTKGWEPKMPAVLRGYVQEICQCFSTIVISFHDDVFTFVHLPTSFLFLSLPIFHCIPFSLPFLPICLTAILSLLFFFFAFVLRFFHSTLRDKLVPSTRSGGAWFEFLPGHQLHDGGFSWFASVIPTERPPFSAKLVPTFADRRCRVISATDPNGR